MKSVILLSVEKAFKDTYYYFLFFPEIPRETPFIRDETGKCVFNLKEYVFLLLRCKIGENRCVTGTRWKSLLPFMKVLKPPKF